MKVDNLDSVSFDAIVDCFLEAFSTYSIKMPTETEYYRKRWKMAKVQFDLSFGMFDDDKLVGFIINAVDVRNGFKTAYNTGTGVIPEYRGQRIVQSIYEEALPVLKKKGIQKCSLEVIKDNEIAIKSYQRIGFEIVKGYKCYKGKIDLSKQESVELRKLGEKDINWGALPNQEFYSWDNQKETVLKSDFECYQVIYNGSPESYFIIDPLVGYISQFDLLTDDKQGWNRLFSGIKTIAEEVKINNVDERLRDKVEMLAAVGVINVVDQFEMELAPLPVN